MNISQKFRRRIGIGRDECLFYEPCEPGDRFQEVLTELPRLWLWLYHKISRQYWRMESRLDDEYHHNRYDTGIDDHER